MDKAHTVYIIMGVSGIGKTHIGQQLAMALSLPFFDGDDFHSPANVQKMERGIPLDDHDRQPWLALLNHHIKTWVADGGAVLACSALKESYRLLLAKGTTVCFIYLRATKAQILERLNKREGHFMPASLLDSQLATLEEPKEAIYVDASKRPEQIIPFILAQIH